MATNQLLGYWSSSWRGGGVSFPLREESFVTALKGCPLKPETLSARLVPGSRIGSVGQVLIEAGFFPNLGLATIILIITVGLVAELALKGRNMDGNRANHFRKKR